MILLTGASGKTGKAIQKVLTGQGEAVRALVHRPDQAAEALKDGATQSICADLLDSQQLIGAMQGIAGVYAMCPNMHPQEVLIGERMLKAAKSAGVQRFVYHSVLHPQTQAMPHHWNKLQVEEMVINSGLDFTILQPCAYMQNILGYWKAITSQGVLALPYDMDARFSLIDLEDVAEAAAKVLTESVHRGAIYELAGPQTISHREIAEVLSQALKRGVQAIRIDPAEWEKQARINGLDEYARETLLKMFHYYDQHGLTGSPQVVTWLLGRSPMQFSGFVARIISGE